MAYQVFSSVCFNREGVTYLSLCREKLRELSCSPLAMPIKITKAKSMISARDFGTSNAPRRGYGTPI